MRTVIFAVIVALAMIGLSASVGLPPLLTSGARLMFHSLSFFLLAALLAVVFVIMSFIVFDRLLRIQFSDARSEWENDGCRGGSI